MDQIADRTLSGTDFAAQAFLARLGERGIDYVFANAGTDFAPIIEAVSQNSGGRKYPRFVTAPHENLAMAMANGYYRVAGKPAAVMLHVTVGTANAICQLMNMARDSVPVLLCAGRTPVTETGHIASRNGAIHWGQESFDQGGMVREFVKWDYELRAGQPIGALVDRALDIAMSEPRGPVYLCLPREVLADEAVPMRRDTVRPLGVAPPVPQLKAIEQAARLIAEAESPLIITSAMGRSADAVAALGAFAATQAIPVLQINATDMNLPSDHEMNLGYGPDPNPYLAAADLVIVINAGVPWMPRLAKPKASAKVIHIGIDPLVSRHPFREYEADLLVAGDPAVAVTMLNEVLGAGDRGKRDARRRAVAAAREEMKAAQQKMLAQARSQVPIHPGWLAHCLNEVKAEDAIFINELGIAPNRLEFKHPLSFIGTSLAGGLGAGLGSALGAKLAAREREVIVAVGDGSYMFGNPVPYHFVQRAENLPTLTIVANNHSWLAVRQSTLAVYPNGAAAKANVMPIQDLNPSPSFEKVAECCDGWAMSVADPAKLPDAMQRAFDKVRSGVPALLNVHTQAMR
jgi:acetolactate synthase-1/2/3 large subunit